MNNFAKKEIKEREMQEQSIIALPKILDRRGNLSFIEAQNHIPFKIERTYWIYDVPGGEERGGHAFFRQEEFIVALSGSFDIVITDPAGNTTRHHLNRSYYGVYIPAGHWRVMENFSTNAVSLHLASTKYDPDDYIWDYEEYIRNPTRPQAVAGAQSMIEPRRFDISPKSATVFDCSLFELPREEYDSGNLTALQGGENLPFEFERVFYLYDIPGGEARGAHAHKECHQFLIAAGGAFEVALDDGRNKRTLLLNRPYMGLHIPPGIWAAEQGFSSGSICLVLASHRYNESDYLRTYNSFADFKKNMYRQF